MRPGYQNRAATIEIQDEKCHQRKFRNCLFLDGQQKPCPERDREGQPSDPKADRRQYEPPVLRERTIGTREQERTIKRHVKNKKTEVSQ